MEELTPAMDTPTEAPACWSRTPEAATWPFCDRG